MLELFGVLSGATISNLVLLNASVKGADNVGILAGSAREGVIERSIVKGNVTGSDFVGGLVGYQEGIQNFAVVTGVLSDVIVSGEDTVGGIIGRSSRTTIYQSIAMGMCYRK